MSTIITTVYSCPFLSANTYIEYSMRHYLVGVQQVRICG